MSEHDFELEVVARDQVADDVVALSLRPVDGDPLPEWEPGAHLDLVLTPDLTRQYSLCGEPDDRGAYRVAVLREIAGRGGSAYVHESIAIGTRLRVRGPRNNFALEPARRYLFIAGGIGITPIVPMVAQAQRSGAEWTLVYGGRTLGSMAFRAELTSAYGDRLALHPQDEVGLLDLDAILGSPADDTLVYCCGPEPLLKAVELRCAAWPAGALHLERFAPKEIQGQGANGSFEVEFAKSGVTITVAPGVPVVEAAEQAGVIIETSCREGVCGTCETAVLDGIPEHLDSVLTDDEQAANDVMFPCVSRALSDRLVLDC